ncbi:7TM-DISM domain-containing protein [Rhodoferax sp. TS-BS-61-7]|uniref:sensor histidine kinase n=1 Tax=Rhodoferax sp. TS-BS-61-7 TaxID=2094194 RepID=UPI0013752B21|nr:7TM-DISM domain-containing protein [Rhodoferax sp. TS-BS-61-7]
MRSFFVFMVCVASLAFSPVALCEDFMVSRAVLEDPTGTLSVDAATRADFQPVGPILTKGYTDSAHWLRLVVRAPTQGDELVLRIRPTFIDTVTLFEPAPGGGWKVRTTGDRVPFPARERAAVTLGFTVHPTAPQTTYYLRVQTTSATLLNVEALQPQEAEARELRLNLFQLSYIGFMVGLLAVVLVNYRTQRDRVLLWFVLYLVAYVPYNLTLLGYVALLWPTAPPGALDGITSGLLCGMAFISLRVNRAVLALFDPPRLALRALDLLALVFPLALAVMASGQVRAGLQINALGVLAAAPLLVVVALLARRDAPPGRRVLRTMYLLYALSLLLSMLALLGWVQAIEWNLQATLLHGLVAVCLMFVLLQLRSRQLQREGALVKLDLVRVEQTLRTEQGLREQQNRFMAMLNHELKTPLSVIRMTLGLPDISPADRQGAQRSVMDIDAIVERSLQADRLEQGQLTPQRQPCQVDALLDELQLASQAPQRLRITCQALPLVQTDYPLLRMALGNLLDNALKYAAPHSTVRVTAQPQTHGGRAGVGVCVANASGAAGMPDATRVFAKYYRSAGAYSQTGSGLGLYLVFGMLQLLGGWVRYAPVNDEVRFEVWIPV